MKQTPLHVAYVCDFASIHSRALIGHFSSDQRFRITAVSTRPADPMDGVDLIELAGIGRASSIARSGGIGRMAQRIAEAAPRLYLRARLRETVGEVTRNVDRIKEIAATLHADVVHGLRTHPEGVLAGLLAEASGSPPLFLTTWGQDLVAWAANSAKLRRWTGKLMPQVHTLLPDNARDARLARQRYGLGPEATIKVMPATGGLDLEEMDAVVPDRRSTPGPLLLAPRGYQNVYNRTEVLLEALVRFRRAHPDAHLYLTGMQGHAGAAQHRRWISRHRLEGSAEQIHPQRPELLSLMAGCDLYVSATRSDGLPMSLLEAMYLGQVPVVSRLESTTPPVENGVNGITVETREPADIAEGWQRALVLADDRDALTQVNREMIRTHYDRSRNLEAVAELYRAAVEMAG
jgi:glycosyltransferase involved in cell wall biosynthesis